MSTVYLSTIGVAAPGLNDWATAASVLRGAIAYSAEPLKLTAPELLPATERRRSSDSVRLALRVAEQALPLEAARQLQPVAIFSSAYGDPTVTHKLCELLSETPPAASPTLFHNSVHNAPAGYWSIATANQHPTNSIAAGSYSCSAGLLNAVAQCVAEQQAVIVISYDLPYPEPLASQCPIVAPFASALLFTPQPHQDSQFTLRFTLTAAASSTMDNTELERLRQGNPAAQILPLLQTIAAGTGCCYLPYSEQQQLCIEVEACS
jgi:hypothetical protein